MTAPADMHWMQHALEIARQGQGTVEPNPMVGCVIVEHEQCIASGWHQLHGKEHAEISALRTLPDGKQDLSQATLYVTLEPCCHAGKTPPCTQAILDAGIRRVVVGLTDPFPQVNGGGIAELRNAGVEVIEGVCEDEARQLCAPYLNLIAHQRPWITAKWAMTLDGKIATTTGSSQWISNPQCRERVHELRGRMDGILVGHQTAIVDDPQLTARPANAVVPRLATRIVLAQNPQLALSSHLVQTAKQIPVLVTAGPRADHSQLALLEQQGVEVLKFDEDPAILDGLLTELGKRDFTNLLVEGGSQLLGCLLDRRLIDEVHVFVAPCLIGGQQAPGPVAGRGMDQMADALKIRNPVIQTIDDNIYISGRLHPE